MICFSKLKGVEYTVEWWEGTPVYICIYYRDALLNRQECEDTIAAAAYIDKAASLAYDAIKGMEFARNYGAAPFS